MGRVVLEPSGATTVLEFKTSLEEHFNAPPTSQLLCRMSDGEVLRDAEQIAKYVEEDSTLGVAISVVTPLFQALAAGVVHDADGFWADQLDAMDMDWRRFMETVRSALRFISRLEVLVR